MAHSNILGGDRSPQQPSGRTLRDLGPSDTSDTGSDIAGAPGAIDHLPDDLDGGPISDIGRAAGAGADVGDAEMDGDSDHGGTGEATAAGREPRGVEGADIMPDRIIGPEGEEVFDDEALAGSAAEPAEDVGDEESGEDERLDGQDSARTVPPGPAKRPA